MSRPMFGFVAALWFCSSAFAQLSPPPESPTIHLVKHLNTGSFGAETVRIGDLNADGAPDLLFVQSEYGTRAITCLTATTILGDVLWQFGDPSKENGRIYSDLPVQIYDWDADGWNDVLFVRQAKYVEPPYTGRPARTSGPLRRRCDDGGAEWAVRKRKDVLLFARPRR